LIFELWLTPVENTSCVLCRRCQNVDGFCRITERFLSAVNAELDHHGRGRTRGEGGGTWSCW